MLGGDGIDSSTQVSVVRCAWVPTAQSCHARHSMTLPSMDPTPIVSPSTGSPGAWLPGARVYFKMGCDEDLQWADRCGNYVGPCLS
jgi:hypothetical protein